MYERWERSFSLLDSCWEILNHNRRLILLPLFSTLGVIVVLALGILAAVVAGSPERLAHFFSYRSMRGLGQLDLIDVIIAAFIAVGANAVATFFNAALVAAVSGRTESGKPSVREGMAFALKRADRILAWACTAGSFLLLIGVLRHKAGTPGKVIAFLLSLVWSVASYFVVPILVLEDVGPWEAVRRSTSTLRKSWGESALGGISLGFAQFCCFLVVALVAAVVGGGAAIASTSLVGLVVFGVLLLCGGAAISMLFSAMGQIFLLATYQWATTGELSGSFDEGDMRDAFRNKKDKD